ncbi:hypothetical protein F4778DRAFT_784785 [Xylariomycetidae sp. FL2044]|nr:hypothetical protein F4778DRAFT_784785 [Xylariomycetidae sp. FL2044]
MTQENQQNRQRSPSAANADGQDNRLVRQRITFTQLQEARDRMTARQRDQLETLRSNTRLVNPHTREEIPRVDYPLEGMSRLRQDPLPSLSDIRIIDRSTRQEIARVENAEGHVAGSTRAIEVIKNNPNFKDWVIAPWLPTRNSRTWDQGAIRPPVRSSFNAPTYSEIIRGVPRKPNRFRVSDGYASRPPPGNGPFHDPSFTARSPSQVPQVSQGPQASKCGICRGPHHAKHCPTLISDLGNDVPEADRQRGFTYICPFHLTKHRMDDCSDLESWIGDPKFLFERMVIDRLGGPLYATNLLDVRELIKMFADDVRLAFRTIYPLPMLPQQAVKVASSLESYSQHWETKSTLPPRLTGTPKSPADFERLEPLTFRLGDIEPDPNRPQSRAASNKGMSFLRSQPRRDM